MDTNNSSDSNDTDTSFDPDFATELLEDLVGNSDIDPDTIQELMDQIMEQNKEAKESNNECKNEEEKNHDKYIEHELADPIMDEKLVTQDYIKAHDETPEFFIPIKMLYISCTINDQYITAFIDTGAQISIMNLETATKCGLCDRIDTKHTSRIIGAGDQSQEAVGNLYHVEMILGQYIVPCNFTVLKKGTNIIIGLNFMRAHKILLDVGQNMLKIGNQEISFLNPDSIVDGSTKST